MTLINVIAQNKDLDFRFYHIDKDLIIKVRQNKPLGLIKEVSYQFTEEQLHPDRGAFINHIIDDLIEQVRR